MIDGVKILCIGTDPNSWETHPLLSFSTKVDEQTGEIKSGTKTAFFKGLHFFLIPSTKSNEIHCILRGSLARYYNNGRDNAFDFNIAMLRETIQDLQNRFKIDVSKAIVQHFEYGLNIETEQPPKKIIRGLRAFQSDSFTSLKIDEVFNGRQIQKQEYQYKIYDKALQLRKKNKNILRVELAIKSRKKAKKYGIEVLQDLIEAEKLNKVKPDLLKVWEQMIFHDKGIKWREMSAPQQKKWLFYLDATNWEGFSRQQRTRAKKKFNELKSLFSTSNTQERITVLLKNKIEVLTAENDNGLRNLSKEYGSEKMLRFTDLDKGVNSYHFTSPIDQPSTHKNCVKISKPKCTVCRVDISHKKEGAQFCSKRCNNISQAKKRKKRNRQKITLEKKVLNRLLKELPKKNMRVVVTYQNQDLLESIEESTNSLKVPGEEIRTIQSITIHDRERLLLTSYRARKLAKIITASNERN
ncbi:hypothetical protein V6B16_11490 [Salinimicrobium catena]|uniref:hypothetical protein n=1 Tax=Salinimicrobium catena TaxID=390640 RepID=UPI002FE489DC